MSIVRGLRELHGGNMNEKVKKQKKEIRESVERANNIARYICRKFDLEVKVSRNSIKYYYEDCSVDVTEVCKVSNYESHFAKTFVLEYYIKQYNILTGEYENYIWFELNDGYLVCKPINMKTEEIIDIDLSELLYI